LSTLSTHVLDTALGRPAGGIRITLARGGNVVGSGTTDGDGRVRDFLADSASLGEGEYSLTFAVGDYFAKTGRDTFYNEIVVNFRLGNSGHCHVPLLVSPFGYSTYRGS
jgi:5-hydroxyisourate hydrolase